MRSEGTIVRWDDAKGFGFIKSDAIAQDVFVHVRDFRAADGASPRQGMRVSFAHVHVGGRGPRATAVQPVGPIAARASRPNASPVQRAERSHRPERQHGRPERTRTMRRSIGKPGSGAKVALPLMAVYGAALVWLVWQKHLPVWIIPASILLNFVTFFAYWQDKYAAQKGMWRIKEDTLHVFSLAGGWGGAWVAQQVLRHKSVKESFRATYSATVYLHCAVVAGYAWWMGAIPWLASPR